MFVETLLRLNHEQRAREKALMLSTLTLPETFTQDGVTVTVLQQPKESSGLLEVWVNATYQGKNLILSNPLLYHNPPISMRANSLSAPVEDALGTLKTILVQTIKAVNSL